MESPLYQEKFYASRDASTQYSAERVLGVLWRYIQPKKVVDFGCGVGSWLQSAKGLGATEVLGIEGDWLDKKKLVIGEDEFKHHDLTQFFDLHKAYDLAISLEVGEHFEDKFADAFVKSLTSAAPVVLFSAAIPFQRGVNHVNEQWPSYWLEKFEQQNYVLLDIIRPAVWGDAKVKVWYAQNSFVYVAKEHLDAYPPLNQAYNPTPHMINAVHPKLYKRQVSFQQPEHLSYKAIVKSLPKLTVAALKRYLKRGLGGFKK